MGTAALVSWQAPDARSWLRPPGPKDYKLTRGVLAARIGSARYPGAAVLGVSAAWRTGVGMLRYISPIEPLGGVAQGLPSAAAAVLAARPETLFGAGPCDAWLLGSGTDPADRVDAETTELNALHQGHAPLVVDAGALTTTLTRDITSAPAVLTPHIGEFRRLWAATGLPELAADADQAAAAARLAAHLSATVLLKSSTSIVATPSGRLLSVGPATPWLATAGTGDVLAGILGALVARHAPQVVTDPEVLGPLAATAALVHDAAARIASGDHTVDPALCTGSPITALDVANSVPAAIASLTAI
ncbi:ADP-dependent NAD(P)H-hydrate dehydratase [Leucobacter sp. HY1910]